MSGPDVNYSGRAMEIIDQIDALTQKVREVNESRAAFVAARGEMVADIIAKIKELKLKNVTNGVDIETLRQDLAKKEEELKTLTEEVAKGASGGKLLSEEIEKLRTEISARDAELTDLRKELAESKAQEEISKKEAETLNETVNQLNTEIKRLESELSASTEKNQQITRDKEQELSEIMRQLEVAKGQLEEAKGKLEVANRQLEETNARNEEAQQGLKTQIAELRVELANSSKMQQLANERSSELDEAIGNITNKLSTTYDNLKNEIEKLLNSSKTDENDQQQLLRSILAAVDGEQRVLEEEAFKNVARDKSPDDPSKSIASTLSKSANNFITPFSDRMIKYFKFDESTQEFTPQKANLDLSFLSSLSIDAEELEKIEDRDPFFEKKLRAYEKYKGKVTINPKVQKTGGRRKRVTQKKRPRNKKVTRKRDKRRRTQKKRRSIIKRRTARK